MRGRKKEEGDGSSSSSSSRGAMETSVEKGEKGGGKEAVGSSTSNHRHQAH